MHDAVPFVYRTRLWFDELDPLGILHHSRFVYHLERANKAMFVQLMGIDTLDPVLAPDIYALVRDLELRYVTLVTGECEIRIELRIVKLRAAGLTVAFEFRSADGTVLHARGTRTVCRMDAATKQPAAWTDGFRKRFSAAVATE